MRNKQGFRKSVVLIVAVALLITGCFAGKRASGVKFSGWMNKDEYKLLSKGSANQALYTYAKPGVNVASYTKMLVDPVVVYNPAKESNPEDVQKSVNNFYSILVKTLSKDYEMAKEPGPQTLRLQVAVTNISAGSGVGQTITSILPPGIIAGLATDWITGKPAFAGEASVEAKIIDASTGELLGAGVDRRIADKNIETAMNTWDAVTKVEQIWAKILAYRLCQARGAKDCLPPVE